MHVTDSLALGGAERMLVEIARATDPNRYRVSVCVTRRDLRLASQLERHLELFVLGRVTRADLSAIRRFRRRVRDVELLHVHGRSSLSFVAAALVGIRRKPAIVAHDHWGDAETDPSFGRIYLLALRLLRPIYVGVHEALCDEARRHGVLEVRFLPNAIDLSTYHVERPARCAERPLLGTVVANLRPSKDLELLLRALGRVRHLPWRVSVAGEMNDAAYARTLYALARDLCIEGRVEFLGAREDVPALLAEADFGLLSSRTESGPLVLLEYLAAGLPIVSTLVGTIGRSLHNDGLPGMVNPGDEFAFASAVEELLALSPHERMTRAEKGQALVSRYDIANAMEPWYGVYESAIRR